MEESSWILPTLFFFLNDTRPLDMGKLSTRIYEPFPRRISLNFCGCVECELGFVSSSLIAPHFCWSAPPSCVHGRASFLLPVTRGSTHPLLVNLSIPVPYKRSLTNHKLLVNLIASHWIDATPWHYPWRIFITCIGTGCDLTRLLRRWQALSLRGFWSASLKINVYYCWCIQSSPIFASWVISQSQLDFFARYYRGDALNVVCLIPPKRPWRFSGNFINRFRTI